MNRSFTKEYWLLLGIWAGATLLKGMSVFIDVRMPFYPWFRFSVVFGAVAFALFLLIVIRSGAALSAGCGTASAAECLGGASAVASP